MKKEKFSLGSEFVRILKRNVLFSPFILSEKSISYPTDVDKRNSDYRLFVQFSIEIFLTPDVHSRRYNLISIYFVKIIYFKNYRTNIKVSYNKETIFKLSNVKIITSLLTYLHCLFIYIYELFLWLCKIFLYNVTTKRKYKLHTHKSSILYRFY